MVGYIHGCKSSWILIDGIDGVCNTQISEQPELYRWRFGYSERTYNGSPEDESQVYIERNFWAGAVTGIADDYDADGDGWAVVGVSQVDQLSGVGLEDSESTIDFEVLGNGAAANPYEPILYVYPNTQQCKAYSPTNLGRVVADEIRTLSIAQISNEKCPQELVDDSDFQEPDPKPPKNEGLFDRLRNNLHTIRVQINNLISTLVNQLRMLLMPLRW